MTIDTTAIAEARLPVFFCSFGKDSSVVLDLLDDWLEKILVIFIDCGGLYPDIAEWVAEHGPKLPHFHYYKTPGDIWGYIDENGFSLDVDIPELGRYGKTIGFDALAQTHKIQPWTNCVADRVWSPLTRIVMKIKPDLIITGEREQDRPEAVWNELAEGTDISMFRPIFSWRDDEIWKYIDINGIQLAPTYQRRSKDRRDCWLCLGGHDLTVERIQELKDKWPMLYHRLFEDEGLSEVLASLEGHMERKLEMVKGINEVVMGVHHG